MRHTSYDVIVLGLGGMGSAAAYHLAARGQRVLGLEQFQPAHNQGSSHGRTRVIRQAYFEDPAYVPLLFRSYELWEKLQRDAGRPVLQITGGLMMGRPESMVVSGSVRSAREYNLPHEMWDAGDIQRRYPVFHPPPDTVALFEKQAGFVRPEEGVRAHLALAARFGATLHFEEQVLKWSAADSGVCVQTARGKYEAGRLVIAPGAWAGRMLTDLQLPLEVERQVLYWFAPKGGTAPFERLPIYIWDSPGGMSYGFPSIDGPEGGAKVAFFRAPRARPCLPETVDRTVDENEIAEMRDFVSQLIPAFSGAPCLDAATCFYTNTPDQHFIITSHPQYARVAIACGFSGHGYKFCSVVGEILADLSDSGKTRHPIELFSPQRFSLP